MENNNIKNRPFFRSCFFFLKRRPEFIKAKLLYISQNKRTKQNIMVNEKPKKSVEWNISCCRANSGLRDTWTLNRENCTSPYWRWRLMLQLNANSSLLYVLRNSLYNKIYSQVYPILLRTNRACSIISQGHEALGGGLDSGILKEVKPACSESWVQRQDRMDRRQRDT